MDSRQLHYFWDALCSGASSQQRLSGAVARWAVRIGGGVSERYLDSQNLDSEIPRRYLDSQNWVRATVFGRVRVTVRVSVRFRVRVTYDCPD